MRLDNLLGGLLDAITGGDRSRRDQYDEEIESSSRDPFGDPADIQPRDVRPASEDPYGDPADEMNGDTVMPSSRDPYGDPADRH